MGAVGYRSGGLAQQILWKARTWASSCLPSPDLRSLAYPLLELCPHNCKTARVLGC